MIEKTNTSHDCLPIYSASNMKKRGYWDTVVNPPVASCTWSRRGRDTDADGSRPRRPCFLSGFGDTLQEEVEAFKKRYSRCFLYKKR